MPSRQPVLARVSFVVSLLALVVALSGTAVAAVLAANSVGTKQLQKGAVTTAKIKKQAVRTATIKDNAVTGVKIRDGAVTGAEIADGSVRLADLATGVLPAAPVTIFHTVPAGTTLPKVTAGGVSFSPSCTAGAGEKTAQITVQPAAFGANDLADSGLLLQTVGVTKTPTSIFGSGASSFEPKAVATAGNAAVTTFEGVVRSGSGPWVRVSIGMTSNTALTACTLQAVISVLG